MEQNFPGIRFKGSGRCGQSRRVVSRSACGFFPCGSHTRFATMPATCETSKQNVGHVPTMVLSGTRGPLLFQVIREGLGSGVRLGARGTVRLTLRLRLALVPERLKFRANHRRDGVHGMEPNYGNTQAVCGFRYLASKLTPFFQTIRVIAAILRARVSRAISGFIPLRIRAA